MKPYPIESLKELAKQINYISDRTYNRKIWKEYNNRLSDFMLSVKNAEDDEEAADCISDLYDLLGVLEALASNLRSISDDIRDAIIEGEYE